MTTLDQEACIASRFQFVEGSVADVAAQGDARPHDSAQREQIGRGCVVRSDAQVDFLPAEDAPAVHGPDEAFGTELSGSRSIRRGD